MQITILGGGGFLGRKLAARLAQDGTLGGEPITALRLFDLARPPVPISSLKVHTFEGDVTDPAALAPAMPDGTDVVFHLAAVVSAAAEEDFDLGLQVNLQGTLAVIGACRKLARPPRLIFVSSVASFGGGQTAMLEDDARQLPGNSYGAQKAAAELLLQDACRKGFLDLVSLRLPTVIVRPGRPNKAASSFISSILREPLLGLATECPVDEAFAMWICSPRRTIEWFLHAAAMDTTELGLDRGINPPGRSVTVALLLTALEEVAGPEARALVKFVPDAAVERIVGGWPAAFSADRARHLLGFSETESLEDIIRGFMADDLQATRAERGL